MQIDQALRDVSILVVDEQSFRRDYVADVLQAAGGVIFGQFDNPASALESLAGMSRQPQLAYVGSGGAVDGAFVEELATRGLSCVAIWPSFDQPATPVAPGIVLNPPLGGFQIVDALARLHRECMAASG